MANPRFHPVLQELAEVHAERSWRLASALTSNFADAEDVIQQALVIAATKLEHTDVRDPWSWFATILVNVNRHHRRKFKHTEELHVDMPGTRGASPEEEAESKEAQEKLKAALADLPQREREAVATIYFSGLSYRKAAEVLGESRSTIKSRVDKGLGVLREKLGKSEAQVSANLSLLPFALPSIGLEQAFAQWANTASASVGAGIGGAGAASAIKVVGAGIMMKKSALAVGALLCVGVGTTAGVLGSQALADAPPETYLSSQNENQTQQPVNSEVKPDLRTPKAGFTLIADDELQQKNDELSRMDALLSASKAERGELRATIAKLESLVAAQPVQLTDEEVAAKAKELRERVEAAIEAKDGKAIRSAMDEFAEIGTRAVVDYFDSAQMLLEAAMMPGMAANELGISMFEVMGLIDDDVVRHVLDSDDSNISMDATMAAFSMAAIKNVPEEVRVKAAVRLLGNPDSGAGQYGTVQMQFTMFSSASSLKPYAEELSQAALNPALSSQGRALALTLLMDSQGTDYDYGLIKTLANETDPEIREVVEVLEAMLNPAATGIFVIEPSNMSAAITGGLMQADQANKLQKKDIIMRVQGVDVEDEAAFSTAVRDAKNEIGEEDDTEITLEVLRGHEVLIVSLRPDAAVMQLLGAGFRIAPVAKK